MPTVPGVEMYLYRRHAARFHYNIAKRMLIHVAGFNLGLLMRKRFGAGTPRGLLDGQSTLLD